MEVVRSPLSMRKRTLITVASDAEAVKALKERKEVKGNRIACPATAAVVESVLLETRFKLQVPVRDPLKPVHKLVPLQSEKRHGCAGATLLSVPSLLKNPTVGADAVRVN